MNLCLNSFLNKGKRVDSTSLVTQMVTNPPAVRELGALPGWEEPLEKGTATEEGIHRAWNPSQACLC